MNRRYFLKSSGVLTTSFLLSEITFLKNAFADGSAQPGINPFFVEIVMDGGWHTSLSLDPWINPIRLDEKDAFIEYRHDELIKEGSIYMGPAMASLRPYASKLNIINGIFVSPTDGGHAAAQVYMMSGKGSGVAAAFCAEYELNHEPSAFGVLFNGELYTGASNVTSTSIESLKQLQSASSFSAPFQNPQSPITKAFQVNQIYSSNIETFKKLNADFIAGGKTQNEGSLIADAFKSGLASAASLKINEGSMDTHSSHPVNHLKVQTANFEKIKAVFDSFQAIEWKDGQSMFDATTFYITSEFSRTPALDASKGTNHNPLNNSAIIIGPKFKGNTVFGSSRIVTSAESPNNQSYLVAQMVDLATGEILKSKADAQARGSLIRPENIIATLAEGLGVQRNIFSAIEMDVKSISSLLKT
jgi:hypothetical protein